MFPQRKWQKSLFIVKAFVRTRKLRHIEAYGIFLKMVKDEWTNEQTDGPTFWAACCSYKGDSINITRIAGSVVYFLFFAYSAFTLTCSYSYTADNSKIKQRRHLSLHELFIDGTEIDLINNSIKSFKLHIGSFISSTEENMNKINAHPPTWKS